MSKNCCSFLWTFILLLGLLAGDGLWAAASWRAWERRGDRAMGANEYSNAVKAYIRAIVIAPKPPPKRLWSKHSRAYAKTPEGMAEMAKMKRSGGRELPPWMKKKPREEKQGKLLYGPSEKVKTRQLHTLASKAAQGGYTEKSRVVAPEYEISEMTFERGSTGCLTVRGRARNKSGHTIHNPRIYITLYDQTGNLKGRKWAYLQRGRNTLERGDSKPFELDFMAFHGTVGYYKARLSAHFKSLGRQ